jgi:adenine deaminase
MMDNQWQKSRKKLIDVAMGRLEADLVINNGRWVSVQSGEIIKDTDIAVIDGLIAYVGPDAKHAIGDKTIVIDGGNRFLVPGLLDGHMHVESTMLTITEFVRAVLPRGTTGIFIDPHEIANVFGLKGVRLMVDEAAQQPIHVWVQVPSCVPSAPGLETPGASIEPGDVAEAMTWDGVIGLGEMMNFPGVFNGDEKMLAEMAETIKTGKTIGGHYASFDLGLPFHGYAAGGPEDDHEGTRLEDAIARIRQGMKVMMRYGSGWLDVAAQIQAVTEKGLDSRHFILCTDDFHSETVVKEGHMDRVVRHAIDQGVDPLIAIQMATINTAQHFGVDREIGMIAPGRYADILLVADLSNFQADVVIAKGVVAAERSVLVNETPPYPYPEWATTSVNLGRSLTAKDFQLFTDIASSAIANVIGVIENQAPTRHIRKEVEVIDGEIAVNIEEDLAKVAVVDRHRGTGNVQVGLVTGFGFTQSCGLASTVAHDSHHMVVLGTNEVDMAIAANELAKGGGGQIVVRDGEVVGLVELPIAGLMSNEPAAIVASKAASVLDGFKKCGCRINNPNMQMSLLALVVIPEIRLSDKGLVDVTKFDFIPVLEEKLQS